ncbi:MAG: aspartate/glutamate racemase family protein [Actinomycetota bacterium]
MTTIGIINAADTALALARRKLSIELPAADSWALLDDRLLADLAAGKDAAVRLKGMAATLESGGADAIWVTCSSFPAVVQEIRQTAGIPVTGPDELMFDALAAEDIKHFTTIYSVDPARQAAEYHLQRTGLDRSAQIDWVKWHPDPAAGPIDHASDALGASVSGGSRRIILAQYSLEPLAIPLEERYGIPVAWGLPFVIDFIRPDAHEKEAP